MDACLITGFLVGNGDFVDAGEYLGFCEWI